MARGMTYKAAGVDIALKQSLIPLFGSIARTTAGAHVIGGVGGFGALVGLNGARKMRAPVLVAGTDSVGTKLMIAFETGRHDTVGIDCVAMCVNDIICHAARPLFFLDYIGSGKLEKKIALDIVKGVARGCAQAGMQPGRRRDGAAQRIVQARRVRPGRLRGGNSRTRANSRAVRCARRRRADRSRIQRTSLQRLLAGAPRSARTRQTQARLATSPNWDARSARNSCVPRSSTRASSSNCSSASR